MPPTTTRIYYFYGKDMSIFTVVNNQVVLTNVTNATDTYIGGMRFAANGSTIANGTFTAGTWANGVQLNPSGAVCVINATAGIPAINTTINGMKFDGNGSICISTGSMVTYNNGLPLDVNGSLSVNLIP